MEIIYALIAISVLYWVGKLTIELLPHILTVILGGVVFFVLAIFLFALFAPR